MVSVEMEQKVVSCKQSSARPSICSPGAGNKQKQSKRCYQSQNFGDSTARPAPADLREWAAGVRPTAWEAPVLLNCEPRPNPLAHWEAPYIGRAGCSNRTPPEIHPQPFSAPKADHGLKFCPAFLRPARPAPAANYSPACPAPPRPAPAPTPTRRQLRLRVGGLHGGGDKGDPLVLGRHVVGVGAAEDVDVGAAAHLAGRGRRAAEPMGTASGRSGGLEVEGGGGDGARAAVWWAGDSGGARV